MKILHLIDIPWWSGLSEYAFHCLQAHRDSGHEVRLACQKDSLVFRRAGESGIPLLPIAGRAGLDALQNFPALGLEIRRFRPDCIVAHTGSTHWIAWCWGKHFKIPIIRTRATSQLVQGTPMNARLYAGCWWVVTASEKIRQDCLGRLSLSEDHFFRTLYPPSPFEGFRSDAPPSGRRVGMLARLDPVKGQDTFLAMARIVQELLPDAEFQIAGSEENLKWSALLVQIHRSGLRNVRYRGFLDGKEVAAFLNGCSLGVIASNGSEEVSRALLEWMSLGKPVVATNVGCIPELLRDSLGGFIVPAGDAQAMANKVQGILSTPHLLRKMGEYNQTAYQERFSRARFRAEWDRLLSQ